MKGKMSKLLLALLCAINLMAISSVSDAYWYRYRTYHHGYYPHRYYHRAYWHGCRWVAGHWYRGYWVSARRVCW